MLLALELLDLLADGAGLFFRIPGARDSNFFARHIFSAQGFSEPALVMRDQMRGGGEDVPGGAVVALQADDLGAREVMLEAQDIVHFRPAPAIDRLVIIPDAADVFLFFLCSRIESISEVEGLGLTLRDGA